MTPPSAENELDPESTEYARLVGERLRAIRRQKRLSLQEAEELSGQEFKASVLGAYERGERAISYTKGCYLGQEPVVMARDRGHVNRHLRGIRCPALLAKGVKLFRDGAEVGQVTSAVQSPRFGAIALAYVRRGNDTPGTQLEAETDGTRQSVVVSSLPFAGS